MDRHEPELRKRSFQHGLRGRVAVEPFEEPAHLLFEPLGRRCFEAHSVASDGTGDHLHRCGAVVTPGADRDSMNAASSRREKGRVPADEALHRQRLVVVLCRVQHHLHDAFDVAIHWLQPADVDSEAPRDGRSDLIGVQLLALDFAALQHVFRQRAEELLPLGP
jgi:hypothetical protein